MDIYFTKAIVVFKANREKSGQFRRLFYGLNKLDKLPQRNIKQQKDVIIAKDWNKIMKETKK